MKDSKGNEIKLGMTVEVPEPNESDLHNHDFVGCVDSFRNGLVIVQDQDNEFYSIEPERLTAVYDADELVQVSREEVVKAMVDWINEADHKTLMSIYNSNFDEPLQGYSTDTETFIVSKQEADRVGMQF